MKYCTDTWFLLELFDKKTRAKEAAKVSLTNSLHLIDSLIAATCKLTGCDALLTADSDYKPLVKKKYLKVTSW